MKRFLSLMLTLTMLTTLFIGFSVPASADTTADVTFTVTPDVTEIAGKDETATITYTIKITPGEGKSVGVLELYLDPSENLTITKGTINSAELLYMEGVFDNGIFANYSYTANSKKLVAYGTTPERILSKEVTILTVTATVDASIEATHTLGLKDVKVGVDSATSYSNVVVNTTDVKAEGIHVCGNLTEVPAKAATCTEAGNKAHYVCKCGEKYEDKDATTKATDVVIAALGHSGEEVPAKAATCTETGNVAYFVCTVCNANYESKAADAKKIEDVEIAALGHNFGELVSANDASCDKDGNVEYYPCTVCKKNFDSNDNSKAVEIKDVVVPKLNHKDAKEVPANEDATCGEPGNIAHVYCEACGKYFVDKSFEKELTKDEVFITVQHNYGELVPAKAKTCTEDGKAAHYQCSICEGFFNENKEEVKEEDLVIPASHELTLVPAKAKTCTEDGNIEHYKCSVEECGKLFKDEKGETPLEAADVVLAAGHEMTHNEAKEASCKEEGNVEYYACSICKKNFEDEKGAEEITESVIIPKLPHTEEEIPAVEATCVKSGLTAGKKCSVCNTIIEAQKPVAKKAHDLVKTDAVEPTCIDLGYAEYWTCSVEDCKMMFADEAATEEIYSIADVAIDMVDHVMGEWEVTKEATDSEDGQKKRVCIYECGEEDIASIPMLGTTCDHAEWETSGVVEIIKEATCTEAGLMNIICSECYEVAKADVEIPALNHMDVEVTAIRAIEAQAATCTEAGYEAYYECGICGELFSDAEGTTSIEAPVEIAALGHDFSGEAVEGVKTCKNLCGETQKVTSLGGSDTEGDEPAEIVVEDQKLADAVITEDDEVLIENGYTVTPSMEVEEVTSPAAALVEKIEEVLNDVIANIKAFIVDITIEKTVSHTTNGEYVEPVTETEAPVEATVTIPGDIRGKDNYRVIRLHDGVADEITTTPNADGEYIVVDKESHKVKLFVKKFSEYAIVGEDEAAPAPTPGPTGGSSSSLTVKFVTNAPKSLSSVRVRKGATLSEPAAIVNDGYIFDGWYTDASFTEKYDFSKAVTKNFTLYAKWIATDAPVVDGEWVNAFADVKAEDWFFEAVKYANINGLMNGVAATEFAPNANVTRGMFVTVLYRIEKEPEVKEAAFTDVAADAWYAKAVAWASENGITSGVSETEFAPDNNISREQIATMLYRYANYKKYAVADGAELAAFADAEAIADYAIDAFKWAVADGIMNGKTATTLNPADNATRAETAALLMRVIEKYNK